MAASVVSLVNGHTTSDIEAFKTVVLYDDDGTRLSGVSLPRPRQSIPRPASFL